MNVREITADILRKWLQTQKFPDRLIEKVDKDRPFIMEVVYGAVKRRRTLEWTIERCVRNSAAPETVPFLFVGLYQILFMSDVPDYAAVNETVKCCSRRFGKAPAGFVNAILRKVLRERQAIEEALAAASLGVRESHPDDLLERWIRQFGEARTASLCLWNNSRAVVTICVNPSMTTVANYHRLLKAGGFRAEPHPFAPDRCLALEPGAKITALPGYAAGFFSVQDPATITPVLLLDLRPGHRVLDACAAPGGKTMLIAPLVAAPGGAGRVTALDLYEDRLVPLRENMQRMRFDNVDALCGNAAAVVPAGCGTPYDRILVDAPCTNTGVLRRRVDARWRFSAERLETLAGTQLAILNGVASLLKPGGLLVYSVCSLEPEEGELLVRAWLAGNEQFTLVRESLLFPPDTGTDGGYSALLKRR